MKVDVTLQSAKSTGAVGNVMHSGEWWEPCTAGGGLGATEPKEAPEGQWRLEPAAGCGQMGWPWRQCGGRWCPMHHTCSTHMYWVFTLNPLFYDLNFCILLCKPLPQREE